MSMERANNVNKLCKTSAYCATVTYVTGKRYGGFSRSVCNAGSQAYKQ